MENQNGAQSGSAPKNAGNAGSVKIQIPLFYIQKDGNGFEYRIANMNHPLVCARKGIIQVEAIRRSQNKQPGGSFCNAYDSRTRIWYGVPTGIHPITKQLTWKRFQNPEFREYNLANEEDAVEWAILSRCEFMEGSLLKQGRVLYKKYDIENEAEKQVAKIGMMQEAISIVQAMKLKDWINAARYLGKTPEGLSAIKLQAEVFKVASNNPVDIIEYWKNSSREIIDLFNAAKSVGIISFDNIQGWMHKRSLPIGRTEQLAIAYIAKEVQFAASLKADVLTKDKVLEMVSGKSANTDVDMNNFENQESEDLTTLKMKASLLQIQGFEIMEQGELQKRVSEAEANLEEEEVDF